MKYDNPAARLHRFITSGNVITSKTYALDAFSQLLGIQTSDAPYLYASVGHVLALPEETKSALQKINSFDDRPMQQWYPIASDAVRDFNIRAKWHTFHEKFTPECLSGISYSAGILSNSTMEQEIPKVKIDTLIATIDQMLHDIDDPELNISSSDWKFINRMLQDIRKSLCQYDIQGMTTVHESFYYMNGALLNNRGPLQVLNKPNKLGIAFASLIGLMGSVCSLYGEGVLEIALDFKDLVCLVDDKRAIDNPSSMGIVASSKLNIDHTTQNVLKSNTPPQLKS